MDNYFSKQSFSFWYFWHFLAFFQKKLNISLLNLFGIELSFTIISVFQFYFYFDIQSQNWCCFRETVPVLLSKRAAAAAVKKTSLAEEKVEIFLFGFWSNLWYSSTANPLTVFLWLSPKEISKLQFFSNFFWIWKSCVENGKFLLVLHRLLVFTAPVFGILFRTQSYVVKNHFSSNYGLQLRVLSSCN